MNHRLFTIFAMMLCLGFATAGIVAGQDDKQKDEEELLSDKEFSALMADKVKVDFGKVRLAARNKSAKELVAAANNLESHAGKILKYRGPELLSDKPARDNKDFKKHVDALKKAAARLAGQAEGSDWDKVDETVDEIGATCGTCHDGFRTLDADKYHSLMNDDINRAWSVLKINARKKMGENAAKGADDIAALAPKILRYEGPVLQGKNKGKPARHQKDFQKWVKELKEAAEDYAKHARKGDWDKAEDARDRISDTCADCHDEYEPID